VGYETYKTHQILERSHFLFVDFFLCCLRRICKLQPVVDVCTWDVKRCVMPMSGVSGPYICGSVDGSPAMWRYMIPIWPLLDKGVSCLWKTKIQIMPKNVDGVRVASSNIVRCQIGGWPWTQVGNCFTPDSSGWPCTLVRGICTIKK